MNKLLILMPRHFLDEVHPLITERLPHLEIETVAVPDINAGVELNILRNANFILCTGVNITREMLAAPKNLQLVQKWGSGVDGIDLAAARELGVPVANIPGGNATSVAEHCFGLMLALYKRLCRANQSLREGEWCQEQLVREGLEELSGKMLGIVGLGNIGLAIARRAAAFEMELNYHNRHQSQKIDGGDLSIRYAELDQLFESSDVVVLAIPLNSETNHLCNKLMFEKMKRSAILINVSRGGIVNEADLFEALFTRQIAGAGLDVFEDEPPNLGNPLFQLPNVVVTPHVAGRTRQALIRITVSCANNIGLVAQGGVPRNIVTGF
jgi:phosphoglycerate dehydrogenase-like enzyme